MRNVQRRCDLSRQVSYASSLNRAASSVEVPFTAAMCARASSRYPRLPARPMWWTLLQARQDDAEVGEGGDARLLVVIPNLVAYLTLVPVGAAVAAARRCSGERVEADPAPLLARQKFGGGQVPTAAREPGWASASRHVTRPRSARWNPAPGFVGGRNGDGNPIPRRSGRNPEKKNPL